MTSKSPSFASQHPLRQVVMPFLAGAGVAILGGLIGLGGAEFRLPILVNWFQKSLLRAIILNLAISLVTVSFSLLFRLPSIPFSALEPYVPIILILLVGSLCGSYLGVHFATRVSERVLRWIIVVLLIVLGLVLMGQGLVFGWNGLALGLPFQIIAGLAAGIVIGVFSSLLGIAGGELIIPTLVVLFGMDIKLAGSASLAISIPTILVGLIGYARRDRLRGMGNERSFLVAMALGSILGALIGSYLVRFAPSAWLHMLLGAILLFSAVRLALDARHDGRKEVKDTSAHEQSKVNY